MKLKFLVILSLAAVLFLGGCGKKDEGNLNANKTNVSSPTPVVKTNETAAVDNTLKTKIEDALKKKGFSDVTIDTTTTPATLRGTVPKGKLAEAVQTAQEAGGKPVKNEVTEK